MQDVLLNNDNEVIIKDGDFSIGDSFTQEVGIILGLSQGQLKSDPVLGPNLIQMIRSKANRTKVETKVKLHLKRDKKDFEAIKKMVNIDATVS